MHLLFFVLARDTEGVKKLKVQTSPHILISCRVRFLIINSNTATDWFQIRSNENVVQIETHTRDTMIRSPRVRGGLF